MPGGVPGGEMVTGRIEPRIIAALRSRSLAQRTQAPTSYIGSRSDPGRAEHDRREDQYI